MIEQSHVAFDVVAMPAETPFIQYVQAQGKLVISGAEMIVLQAVEQFEFYTQQRPSDELINMATVYACSNTQNKY